MLVRHVLYQLSYAPKCCRSRDSFVSIQDKIGIVNRENEKNEKIYASGLDGRERRKKYITHFCGYSCSKWGGTDGRDR